MKKYFKQLKANKKGFTLIEMIVVIGIIGILAAILVPSISGYLRNAKDTKKDANARTIYTAAQAAVTSLETTTTPVATGTYTKSGESEKGSGGIATDAIAVALFNKIEQLVGESNYSKFNGIVVITKDGAVTEVQVKELEGDIATKYPK